MGKSQALRSKGSRSNPLFCRISRTRLSRTRPPFGRNYLKRLRGRGVLVKRQLLLLLQLLRQHLMVALLIFWAMLAGATVAAVTTLMNPNASAPLKIAHQYHPTIAPIRQTGSSPIVQFPISQVHKFPTPHHSKPPTRSTPVISTVGAILLSCASGCLMLLRCLTPRSAVRWQHRPDLSRRLAHQPAFSQPITVTSGQALAQPAVLNLSMLDLSISQPEELPTAPISQPWPDAMADLADGSQAELGDQPELSPDPDSEVALETVAASPVTDSPVTAAPMPPPTSHPFDWIDPSLANHRDLRKHQSISDWLERL